MGKMPSTHRSALAQLTITTIQHLNPFSLSLRINTQEIASTLIPPKRFIG